MDANKSARAPKQHMLRVPCRLCHADASPYHNAAPHNPGHVSRTCGRCAARSLRDFSFRESTCRAQYQVMQRKPPSRPCAASGVPPLERSTPTETNNAEHIVGKQPRELWRQSFQHAVVLTVTKRYVTGSASESTSRRNVAQYCLEIMKSNTREPQWVPKNRPQKTKLTKDKYHMLTVSMLRKLSSGMKTMRGFSSTRQTSVHPPLCTLPSVEYRPR